MDREEAEQRANELLSHYGEQSWAEHFRAEFVIDNPANHILVKSVEEFTAMLARRGYSLSEETYGVLCAKETYHFTETFFLYRTRAEVARDLDRLVANGQHHMQCAQCNEPLLRQAVGWTHMLRVTDPPLAISKRSTDYVYRSAKAGPDSPALSQCPGCQSGLGEDTVQEIRDV